MNFILEITLKKKTFEDLVIEFDSSIKDRRKYNNLMNGLLLDWFYNQKNVQESIFDKIVLSLFDNGNISKYSYIILKKKKKKKDGPLETELFWFDTLDMVGDPGDIREDLFILKSFTRQFVQIDFFTGLVEMIPHSASSVRKLMKLLSTYFVHVRL